MMDVKQLSGITTLSELVSLTGYSLSRLQYALLVSRLRPRRLGRRLLVLTDEEAEALIATADFIEAGRAGRKTDHA